MGCAIAHMAKDTLSLWMLDSIQLKTQLCPAYRAGPVPDEEGDLSDGSDMIGEDTDEDEVPAAAQRMHSEEPSGRHRNMHSAEQPGSKGVKARQAEVVHDSAAGSLGEQQSRGAQQGRSTHDQGRLQRSAGASAAGPRGSEKIAGESRQGEEGIAGKASLHGKHHRSKPLSRVQRIAAEVQARKVLIAANFALTLLHASQLMLCLAYVRGRMESWSQLKSIYLDPGIQMRPRSKHALKTWTHNTSQLKCLRG